MSTRANFIVTDGSLTEGTYQFYSHYDGYPSGLGHDLASLIRSTKPQDLESAAALAKHIEEEEFEHEEEYDNNICPHGDIEYFYVINTKTKTLTCYWCMSWDVPDSDFNAVVEMETPDTTDLAMVFSVPFGATPEIVDEVRSQRKDAIKDKLNGLKQLVENGKRKVQYRCFGLDERTYTIEK